MQDKSCNHLYCGDKSTELYVTDDANVFIFVIYCKIFVHRRLVCVCVWGGTSVGGVTLTYTNMFFFLAQMSFSNHPLSICKLLHFQLLLRKYRASFNQTWHKSWERGFKWQATPFPKGDNSKRVKTHWKFFKDLPLQYQQAIFNHTWYKTSLGKGNSNCSNQGPRPLQREDNHKNRVGSFKILLKNHWARKTEMYMNTSWHGADLSLLKS
jgi:hypothetical protein